MMNISIIDGSNYFKGLLLLVRKDRKLSESEILMMQRIGKQLGFEREFCDNAIHDILENTYIDEAVPVFSTKELAEKFVKDGLSIAFSDRELHPSEEVWLRTVAEQNGLNESWFRNVHDAAAKNQRSPETMEVEEISVKY